MPLGEALEAVHHALVRPHNHLHTCPVQASEEQLRRLRGDCDAHSATLCMQTAKWRHGLLEELPLQSCWPEQTCKVPSQTGLLAVEQPAQAPESSNFH